MGDPLVIWDAKAAVIHPVTEVICCSQSRGAMIGDVSRQETPGTAPGAHFDNLYAARKFLEQRWQSHPTCPNCGAVDCASLIEPHAKPIKPGIRRRQRTFRTWKCKKCKAQFTATTGTRLHGTHLPHKWLAARKLLLSDPTISGRELARRLDVDRKTATAIKKRLAESDGVGAKK